MKKRPIGRPLKLTKAIHDEIVGAIMLGCEQKMAAQAAGISETTFYRWMTDGETKAPSHPLHLFFLAVRKAQGEAYRRNVTVVAKASATNWQAAAWWLERRYPDQFGLRQRVEHAGGIEFSLEDIDALRRSMEANANTDPSEEPK